MKKFNAKKVIVSGAVALLLVGGTVAAASEFWLGHNDVLEVQKDLVTLDSMLDANETKIGNLTTQVSDLEQTIDALIISLGLESGDYSDLQAKLDKIQEEANTNKQFSKDAKIILGQIESATGGTSVTDENNVNARVASIYSKALVYHKDLKKQISDLSATNAKLLADKVALTDKLEEADADLAEAAADVAALKLQSNKVVEDHTPLPTN